MSVYGGPNPIKNGLIFNVDAANLKSYPGSGSTWYDVSGNSRNATLTNAPTITTDGAAFNGTSNYVTIASNADWGFVGSGTISFWSKKNGSGYVIGFQKGGWQGYLISTGSIDYSGQVGGNDFGSSFAVTNGVWYMTTFVVDRTSGYYSFYKNGDTLISTGAITHPSISAAPLYIGARGGVPDNYLNGSVGLVQFYNRALSASEIQQNFNALRGRYGI